MSATDDSAGTNRSRTAQFSRCRSHSRGTSRGPIRPRQCALRWRAVRRTPQAAPPPADTASPRAAAFHVKQVRSQVESGELSRASEPEVVSSSDQDGWTTTRRRGSSPSDSLVRPAAATRRGRPCARTASSASSRTGSPVRLRLLDRLATDFLEFGLAVRPGSSTRPASAGSARRSPGSTASRVSSCSASRTLPFSPTRLFSSAPTIETAARSPSMSMSMSPSRSAMSSRLLEVVGRDVALRLECLQTLVRGARLDGGLLRRLGVLHAVGHGQLLHNLEIRPTGTQVYTSRQGYRQRPVSGNRRTSSAQPSSARPTSPRAGASAVVPFLPAGCFLAAPA